MDAYNLLTVCVLSHLELWESSKPRTASLTSSSGPQANL